MQTRRERIVGLLEDAELTPSAIADALEVPPHTVLDDLEHVARSLDATDRTLLVAPPICRVCGFDGFDDRLNRPSRCPDCRSESIEEPVVTVD